jgi:hypothetical protein
VNQGQGLHIVVLILACDPGCANDNAYMNQNGLDCASMHQARNRRVTYRIRYEMIPELSPDGTPQP